MGAFRMRLSRMHNIEPGDFGKSQIVNEDSPKITVEQPPAKSVAAFRQRACPDCKRLNRTVAHCISGKGLKCINNKSRILDKGQQKLKTFVL